MNRRLEIVAIAAMVSLMAVGCAMKRTASLSPPPPETILESDANNSQASLFKGDQAVLSDQDIARILGTQVKVDERHHLAILGLNPNYFWSQDLAEAEAKNFDNLVKTLKASAQLTDVRFLPSLLVPEKRTVPYLREAAARVQADLLFVYTTRIQTFRHDRFLKPNEVHAQCVAESVLLDVRTGIVVHTGKATEIIELVKTPADANFSETEARAESEARGKALLSLGSQVVEHLKNEEK